MFEGHSTRRPGDQYLRHTGEGRYPVERGIPTPGRDTNFWPSRRDDFCSAKSHQKHRAERSRPQGLSALRLPCDARPQRAGRNSAPDQVQGRLCAIYRSGRGTSLPPPRGHPARPFGLRPACPPSALRRLPVAVLRAARRALMAGRRDGNAAHTLAAERFLHVSLFPRCGLRFSACPTAHNQRVWERRSPPQMFFGSPSNSPFLAVRAKGRAFLSLPFLCLGERINPSPLPPQAGRGSRRGIRWKSIPAGAGIQIPCRIQNCCASEMTEAENAHSFSLRREEKAGMMRVG